MRTSMRLQEVTGRPFIVFCLRCDKKQWAGDVDGQTPVFADLNGEPFKAYYCAECAGKLQEASCESQGK